MVAWAGAVSVAKKQFRPRLELRLVTHLFESKLRRCETTTCDLSFAARLFDKNSLSTEAMERPPVLAELEF